MKLLTVVKLDQCGNLQWKKCNKFYNLNNSKEIILTKFNNSGNILSINKYNTMDTSNQIINPSISTDSLNNVYLTFSNNTGNSNFFNITLMKLDSSGNIIWSIQDPTLNTNKNNITPKIQVDGNFNIYLNYVSQNIKNGEIIGKYNVVVAKFNSSGNLLWITHNSQFNANSDNIRNTMDIDGLGNIYVAYQTLGKLPYGNNSGKYDIVVFKIDNNGNLLWTIEDPIYNTNSDDLNPNISVDIYGNSYIAYNTTGTIPHKSNAENSGGSDIVIFKLNTMGQIIWRAQHPSFNTIDNDYEQKIMVDNKENLYLIYVSSNVNIPQNIILVKFKTTCCFDPCKNCCCNDCNICYPKLCVMDPNICDNIKCNLIKKSCDYKKNLMLDKINGTLSFYHNELNSVKRSIEIINSIINQLNKLSNNNPSNKYILDEAIRLSESYYNEGNKMNYKNFNRNDLFIFGTVDQITGFPKTYTKGFGGITNNQINGNLIVTLDNVPNIFNFTNSCSVYDMYKKINTKYGNKLLAINGLEIGIKFNCFPAYLILKLCYNGIIRTFEFEANNNSKQTYMELIEQLNLEFGDYIKYMDYDCKKGLVYIIFKHGYTLIYSQKNNRPYPQFIISTYVNCIPVNYGTTSATKERYIYGYLLFYNSKNNFIIDYPLNSLKNTKVIPVLLKNNFKFYCQNITLDLSRLITCNLKIMESITLNYNGNCNKFDIKYYVNYGKLLKEIIKCINVKCNICNINKIHNIMNILNQYREMLQCSHNLLLLISNNFLSSVNIFIK